MTRPFARGLVALVIPLALLVSGSARAESERPEAAPRVRYPRAISVRGDGAYSARTVHSLELRMADMSLGVGAQVHEHLAVWAVPRVQVGSSLAGLRASAASLGAGVEGIYGRARLGGEIALARVAIGRAARPEVISSLAPAFRAHLRFDLVDLSDFRLYVVGSLEATAPFSGGAYLGPSLGAGVSFDFASGR